MTTTIYVTRYALSGGIQKVEAEIGPSEVAAVKVRGFPLYYSKADYRLTEEAAVADAEARRERKLKSIEKSIVKLRKQDLTKIKELA